MSEHHSRAILIGHAVIDSISITLESGKIRHTFTIAVNHLSHNKEEKVSYFDIEYWGKELTLHKGNKVTVYGQLKQERWETNGRINSKIILVANKVQIK
jgi:single-stranded DNA-binding protein